MAYNEFAYFYDEFNTAADYDALYRYVTGELAAHGVPGGLLADLGCGTGDLTLMLAQAGYDVIGVDQSEEMLSVLREKADELGLAGRILLLQQDLLELDLYGTIRAAVSTFDTFSHIGPLDRFEQAIAKAAFFMEEGGVFFFSLNPPYKNARGRAGQTVDQAARVASSRGSNTYDPQAGRVRIDICITDRETGDRWQEMFYEYSYDLDTVQTLLDRYGYTVARVADGEDFGPLRPDSQRWIFTAVKRYTQQGPKGETE